MPTVRTAIYTPRVCIDMTLAMPKSRNKATSTKIPYHGFEISIAMDSSHGDGDLSRSDIVVHDASGTDVTFRVLPAYAGRGVVPATADALKAIFIAIDTLVSLPA